MRGWTCTPTPTPETNLNIMADETTLEARFALLVAEVATLKLAVQELQRRAELPELEPGINIPTRMLATCEFHGECGSLPCCWCARGIPPSRGI